jgi:hypothetical protein
VDDEEGEGAKGEEGCDEQEKPDTLNNTRDQFSI